MEDPVYPCVIPMCTGHGISGLSDMLKTFSMGLTWTEGVSHGVSNPQPDRDICEIFLWKTYTLAINIQKHVHKFHFPTGFYHILPTKIPFSIPTHIVHFAARARHGPRWPERRNTSSTPRWNRWNWLHGITFFFKLKSHGISWHANFFSGKWVVKIGWQELQDNSLDILDLPGLLKSAAQEHISAPLLLGFTSKSIERTGSTISKIPSFSGKMLVLFGAPASP